MANTIKIRRSAVASAIPTTGQLALGELALNTFDGKLFIKKDNGTASIVEIGAGGAGATYTVSSTAPSSPSQGDRWLETDAGVEYTYFNDGTSSQWVETGIGGSGGVSDGDKGDISVSASGATWLIDNGVITGTKLASDISISTSGDLTLRGQSDLRFADADSSNWVAFQAPSVVASNVTWTLPSSDGANGDFLTTNGEGGLAWDGFIPPTYNLNDLLDVTISAPSEGKILRYDGDGGQWVAATLSIVNADVNANAAIAFSKLATLTSANILLGSATNVATSTAMSGDVTISSTGVTTVTSASTSAAGKVQLNDTVTSTSTSLAATANAAKTAYDIGAKRAITIENPTATEKIIMFFTTTAMTLSQIRSVIIGGTSVDFRIIYGTDVSAAGTNTTTNAITCNSTTTGVSTTSFSSATVPANNFVWLTTSAVSGTVTQLSVSLVF